MAKFVSVLRKANRDRGLLISGLDPVFEKFPSHLIAEWNHVNKTVMIVAFLVPIINAVARHVAGFKPNVSFFIEFDDEANGVRWGQDALRIICRYIRHHFPDHLLILDGKDGDIGPSNDGYFRRAFDGHDAHALTWNPYLGPACQKQMERYPDRGIIALARTSNPEGTSFQNTICEDGRTVFMHNIDEWNGLYKQRFQVGLVAGATHPTELQQIRKAVGAMPLLVPGVGTQGGTIEDVVKNGFGGKDGALMINISSALLYASSKEDFAEAAGYKALQYYNEVATLRRAA